MKYTILLIFIIISNNVLAEFRYNEFILTINSTNDIKELDKYRSELYKKINKTQNNPWLWYALGNLEWKYIDTFKTKSYKNSEGKITSTSPINLNKLAVQKEKSFKAFKKSYLVHQTGHPKLSTNMLLHILKTSNDLSFIIKIHREIIKEDSKTDLLFGPNNTKLEFRRSLVRSMIRAKKYKTAMSELDTIEQEFPKIKNHKEWRQYYMEHIEREKSKKKNSNK